MASRKLVVEIVGDSRSLEKAFAKSSRSAKGFQKDVTKTHTVGRRAFGGLSSAASAFGVAFGGAAVVAGIRSTIDASKDLGESINAVNVVFGDASKTVTDFSETAATQVGLSAREINQLVTPLGAAFTNMGDSQDEAAKKSVVLTKRAADMASVFNTDVSDALEAIQSALRGEADPIERFGVNLSDARVRAEAVAEGLAKTESAVTDADKATARYNLILKQTTRTQGDFQNTSGGLANQQRILSAQLENLKAKIGQQLLPILVPLLTQLNRWLSNSKNQKTVLDLLKSSIGAVAAAVKILHGAFKLLSDIVGSNKRAIEVLIGIYAAWKISKLITNIANLAGAFKNLARQEGAAAAAGAGGGVGGRAGRVGRLGRVGRALPLVGTGIALSQLPHPKILDQSGISLAKRGFKSAFGMNVQHQENHFHGVQNPRQMEHELTKRAAGRPHRRRGAR